MFARSVSSNSLVAPQPCDNTSAEDMAAKKARTEVVNYTDMALEKINIKEIGKSKNGSPTMLVLHDGFGVTFNLTPSGWLSSKHGFDVNCQYNKPSFLHGEKPAEGVTSENLAIRIYLDDAQAKFLQEIDQKAKEAYTKVHQAEWKGLVAQDRLFGGDCSVKVHVCLEGKDLTKLTVVKDGKVDRGEGWAFLKDYMGSCNNFKNADVKVCLRFKSVWNVKGMAGLKLCATRIVLRGVAALEEDDPFADDDELLA